MKLILLGTGGYHASDSRQTACFMLPELGVVLDAGTALYRVRDYLETRDLNIFLTHAHLDHVIGVTYLFDVVWGRTLQGITVHGTPETLRAIDDHLLIPALFPVRPPFETRLLTTEVAIAGQGRLTHFPLLHPGQSIGFRIDWPGRSLAYVTDTTARLDASYLERIAGVDLLIHECYFDDDLSQQAELTGHSCVTPVAELARAAKVGRLLLVHFNPLGTAIQEQRLLEKACQIFPNTQLGFDRMEIEF